MSSDEVDHTPYVINFDETIPFVRSVYRILSILFNNMNDNSVFIRSDDVFIMYNRRMRALTLLIKYQTRLIGFSATGQGEFNTRYESSCYSSIYLPHDVKISKELLIHICDICDKIVIEEFDYNPIPHYNISNGKYQECNMYQVINISQDEKSYTIRQLYNNAFLAILKDNFVSL